MGTGLATPAGNDRSTPLRIAYVTETFPPEINGVSLTAERTLHHLREAGHAVQLVRPRQPGEAPRDDAQEWRCASGPIPRYPDLRFGLARPGALRARWTQAAGGPPDLVHITTPGPLGWAALRAARSLGLHTAADFRTNFHAYSRHYGPGWLEPLVLGYLRRLHQLADCSFVPTPAMACALAASGFERLEVVGRGVDARQFSPRWRSDALRRSWDVDDGSPVLLHVGRLAPEKNVELALQAYAWLSGVRPDLRMVVVGDGPCRQRLARAHPRVRFVGAKRGEELARHYASADLFLFPSLTDTFGNVTLEALASGLVVVAFDTAAAALHIRSGISGCLAPLEPVGDQRVAFFEAVARGLGHARPGSALRLQAVQSARRADWDSVLRHFERRLRAVAAGAVRGAPVHAAVV